MSREALFHAFSCKSLTVRNRIAMAPMTRSHSPGGILSDAMCAYYQRRAEGGISIRC